MGTIIVSIILIGLVALVIRSMIKNKKAGKMPGCSCGCSDCPGKCSSTK